MFGLQGNADRKKLIAACISDLTANCFLLQVLANWLWEEEKLLWEERVMLFLGKLLLSSTNKIIDDSRTVEILLCTQVLLTLATFHSRYLISLQYWKIGGRRRKSHCGGNK